MAGVEENEYGIRFFEGTYVNAYLSKRGSIPGYTIALWSGHHIDEPTRLKDNDATGYWLEVVKVGRALESCYDHAKLNYQTLGNSIPHLHTHIVPRPLIDPAPHGPLPWSYLDDGRQDPTDLRNGLARLRAALSG